RAAAAFVTRRASARFAVVAALAAGCQAIPPADKPAESAAALDPPAARVNKASREVQNLSGEVPGPDFTPVFDKTTARIRMRDGAELYTEIYTPKGAHGLLPILYHRWPYGLIPDKAGYSGLLRLWPALVHERFIFALQDSRGTGASSGKYVT